MRTPFIPGLVVLVVLAVLAPARQTEPSANRELAVVPEAGRWMICASSYTGSEAAALAGQLAEQLRSREKLPAYTYSRSDAERAKQREEDDRLKKTYPDLPTRRRRIRIEDQWAVLIGGWQDFESASAYLAKVKKMPPPDLKKSNGESAHGYLFIGQPDEEKKRTAIYKTEINPFNNAFVIRNPTVPAEVKPAAKFDPLWKQLNEDESYSLLKNRKPWTLVVKEYQGANTLQSRQESSSFLDKLLGNNKIGDALDASARQAHEVARVMRELKFESYVLHTRTGSVISVGGFESPEDPNMQRVAEQIARLKLGPVEFMSRPMPMEVPRP